MSLDIKSVKKVASLARIRMNKEEQARMAPQLSKIIDFIEQLGEVNTDNIEPLANVVDITPDLRVDIVNDGGYAEKILANAPEETQGYFVVPNAIEENK